MRCEHISPYKRSSASALCRAGNPYVTSISQTTRVVLHVIFKPLTMKRNSPLFQYKNIKTNLSLMLTSEEI
jgi:hypothetical protein